MVIKAFESCLLFCPFHVWLWRWNDATRRSQGGKHLHVQRSDHQTERKERRPFASLQNSKRCQLSSECERLERQIRIPKRLYFFLLRHITDGHCFIFNASFRRMTWQQVLQSAALPAIMNSEPVGPSWVHFPRNVLELSCIWTRFILSCILLSWCFINTCKALEKLVNRSETLTGSSLYDSVS